MRAFQSFDKIITVSTAVSLASIILHYCYQQCVAGMQPIRKPLCKLRRWEEKRLRRARRSFSCLICCRAAGERVNRASCELKQKKLCVNLPAGNVLKEANASTAPQLGESSLRITQAPFESCLFMRKNYLIIGLWPNSQVCGTSAFYDKFGVFCDT